MWSLPGLIVTIRIANDESKQRPLQKSSAHQDMVPCEKLRWERKKQRWALWKQTLSGQNSVVFWGLSQAFEVRWTSYSLVNIWDESFFCSPPNYHFSKASASGRRLISWLFLKDGFEEIKGPQNVMERELNCGNFLFGGMKITIRLGSVTVNNFVLFFQKIKAPARM